MRSGDRTDLTGWQEPRPERFDDPWDRMLDEDLRGGDATAPALLPDKLFSFMLEVQASGIICGLGWAAEHLSNEGLDVSLEKTDGDQVSDGTVALKGSGTARQVFAFERPMLNMVSHLSGIATMTRSFVDAVEGTGAKILDTRKTLPGLRILQKYAVRCGGGTNHRMGLHDAAMLKDNHIAASGSITNAVKAVRNHHGPLMSIEVESTTIDQAMEASEAGADVVMLDNMSLDEMTAAVGELKGKVKLEASGGVTLQTVRSIAETGVDYISVGALTHSAPSLSMHLEPA